MSDAERFKDTAPFIVRCRGCQGELSFAPIHDSVRDFNFLSLGVNWLTRFEQSCILSPQGAACPSCLKPIALGSLLIQLEVQIRTWIAKYYEGWTICDDPTCGHRTRMMSVYGRRCLQPGCRGSVEFEVRTLKPVMLYPILIDTAVYRVAIIQSIAILCLSVQRREG